MPYCELVKSQSAMWNDHVPFIPHRTVVALEVFPQVLAMLDYAMLSRDSACHDVIKHQTGAVNISRYYRPVPTRCQGVCSLEVSDSRAQVSQYKVIRHCEADPWSMWCSHKQDVHWRQHFIEFLSSKYWISLMTSSWVVINVSQSKIASWVSPIIVFALSVIRMKRSHIYQIRTPHDIVVLCHWM